uniref:Flagellar biosynthesis protein FlgM n=1 Tax=Strongyloides venezuelensis TaxID=75913 RepID=A0A0K0FZ84_STRVS
MAERSKALDLRPNISKVLLSPEEEAIISKLDQRQAELINEIKRKIFLKQNANPRTGVVEVSYESSRYRILRDNFERATMNLDRITNRMN